MPGFDGTGPMGAGPMTGGGRGFCVLPLGTGVRPGWGRGRGWRNWYYATGLPGWTRAGLWPRWVPAGFAEPTPEQELADLRAEAQELEEYLKSLRGRIDELESKQNK